MGQSPTDTSRCDLKILAVNSRQVPPIDLRDVDRKELMSGGFKTVEEGLKTTVGNAHRAYRIDIKGKPEGYFGVTKSKDGRGQVWFLSSSVFFKEHWREFLKYSRFFLELWLPYYGYLYNVALKENIQSLRWLSKREGFTLSHYDDNWVYFHKEYK